MAAPTFGIDLAAIQLEFTGLDLSSLSSAVTVWIGRAAARVSQELRRVGYDAEDITDTEDDLYQLAADFITHWVCGRVCLSHALQDTALAKVHRDAANDIADALFTAPEIMTPNFDPAEQAGTWDASEPSSAPRSRHRGWSRNDQF